MPEYFFDQLRHLKEFSDVTVIATIGAHNFFRYLFFFFEENRNLLMFYI